MKVIKLETVKAVGGCQQEALVALLKEMGYAISMAEQGVLVKVGMQVRAKSGETMTVAPARSIPAARKEQHLCVWYPSGQLTYSNFDYYTYNGKKVVGYDAE